MKRGRIIPVVLTGIMLLVLGMMGASHAQAAEKIRVGLENPMTGAMAEVGINSARGFELGVKDINKAGGIKAFGGAKLEIVEGDTGSTDPGMAASVARRLIVNGKVIALAGCYASNMTLQASTVAERNKIPMISQSFVDKLTERGYKYYFQLPPKSSMFGNATMNYAFSVLKHAGKKVTRVAVVSSNDAATKKQGETAVAWVKAHGLDLVAHVSYPVGLTDASPIISKIENSKAQVLIQGGIAISDVILIIRNMRAIGINIPVFSTGGGAVLDRGFGDGLGSAANGVFALAAWNWDLPYPGVKKVVESYDKEYHENFMPQEAGEMYIAAWVLKYAMEEAGKPDPTAIRNALATFNSSEGAAGMMTGGRVEFDKQGWNEKVFPVMVEWKDNKPHTVWPRKVAVMEPFFK